MFKNYLKIALRNFLKNKTYSLINTIGLALGLTVVMITALFIKDELGYDQFHENKSNLFRIINGAPDDADCYAGTPAPLGPFLKDNFSQIQNFTRVTRINQLLKHENELFSEKNVLLVDSTFLSMFTFPLNQGEAQTALLAPNAIVITETMAQKYFGDQNPIGKMLTNENSVAFEVTAVAADLPKNSHLHFDFLMRFDQRDVIYGNSGSDFLERWGNWNYFTYVLLAENTDPENLTATVLNADDGSMPDRLRSIEKNYYQPITDIHFQFNRKNLEAVFNKKYLYIFISAAFLVLLLACINVMNLSTSLSLRRAREVGLRKVVGANRGLIIKQFLGESVLFTLLAFVISILLVEILLPNINRISGKALALNYADFNFMFAIIGLVILTGLLSGSYPAFVLSALMPAKIFKNNQTRQSVTFRNVLVVFQFVVTIGLITSIVIINQQLRFIENKNLGMAKNYIVNVPLEGREVVRKSQTIKNEFVKHPNVLSASANRYKASYFNEHWGGIRWRGMSEDEGYRGWWIIGGDEDFLETFNIKPTKDFLSSENFSTDEKWSFIINETARKEMDLETAAGEDFTYWGDRTGRIAGVVEDFHFRSLHHEIAPCAIVVNDYGSHISLKIKSTDMQATLGFIEQKWRELAPNMPFTYYFFDEDIQKLYQSEMTIQQILGYLTFLSIFIACLGLLGLATLIAQQRTKEIGIRKVFGASSASVVSMLTGRFIRWMIIANIIAWPIAYFVMNKWLENFAYRIEVGVWIFALAGLSALLIAALTVSFQAIKAAMANPVESLRYE